MEIANFYLIASAERNRRRSRRRERNSREKKKETKERTAIKKMEKRCWRGSREKGTLLHYCWECKLTKPL